MRILIGLILPAMISPLLAANDSSELFAESLQPVFKEHCIKCHGKDGKVKGKVDLVGLNSVTELLAQPGLLETMIVALEDREMPPEHDQTPRGDTDRIARERDFRRNPDPTDEPLSI